MLKQLEGLLEKLKVAGAPEASKVETLIRWASSAPKKGIYNLNGLVLEYEPSAPAHIVIKAVPSGSKYQEGKTVFQNDGDFGPLFGMLEAHSRNK